MAKQAFILAVDNSLYMQNQDYLPGRLWLEKEACQIIISNVLSNPESAIGIAPLCQPRENYFLTPTSKSGYITNFLGKLRLSSNFEIKKVLARCKICLLQREEPEKKLLIFFGSDIKENELDKAIFDLITNITECIQVGIKVALVLFGEQRHTIKEILADDLNGEIAIIDSDESFLSESLQVLGLNLFDYENDPDLALALKLSIEEEEQRRMKSGGLNKE